MITPLIIGALTISLTVSGPAPQQDAPPAACKDANALTLWRAGFTGEKNRIAWAIVYRESRFTNVGPGNPNFNGSDYGWWQVNAPSHSGSSWWSVNAMLDPARQSRIAYKHMTDKGRVWTAWGLTSPHADGIDASQYGMWSAAQRWQWIWQPYQAARAQYPKECAK